MLSLQRNVHVKVVGFSTPQKRYRDPNTDDNTLRKPPSRDEHPPNTFTAFQPETHLPADVCRSLRHRPTARSSSSIGTTKNEHSSRKVVLWTLLVLFGRKSRCIYERYTYKHKRGTDDFGFEIHA